MCWSTAPSAGASYLVRTGDVVDVEPAELAPLRATPEEIPLTILYEDDDLVAIDKPAGMVVHSGAGVHSGTLVNALLHRFGSLSRVGGRAAARHRASPGPLSPAACCWWRRTTPRTSVWPNSSPRGAVEKTYLALVHGKRQAGSRPHRETHRARSPAARPHDRPAGPMAAPPGPSITCCAALQDFTFLEVRIGTGRTHQIRVHLASIGHPVVGDRLYGAPAKIAGEPTLARYFLHAHRIRFEQPSTGEPVTVVSPLPAELEAWITGLL